MKKSLLIALILIVIFTLFSCGKVNASKQTDETFASSYEDTIKPFEDTAYQTDSEKEVVTETVKTDETETQAETQAKESDIHVHSFGEWQTVKAVTCTEDGEQKRECACGEAQIQTVLSSGHTKVTDSAKLPTCTADGLTEGSHCGVCNTVFVKQTVVKSKGHSAVVDPAIAPTCTVGGLTEGSHCENCNTVLVEQSYIEPNGHTEITDIGRPATCTADGITDGIHCDVCHTVLVEQTLIKAKGHSKMTVPAKMPTCTELGYSEAIVCSACDHIFSAASYSKATGHTVIDRECIYCDYVRIDFNDIDIYGSNYGYDYLKELPNGELMQTVYLRLDAASKKFHSSNKTAQTLESVECGDLGLKIDDIQLAVSCFIHDRPLYYWLEGGYTYSVYPSQTVKSVTMNVASEYSSGEARATYNALIYEGAEEYYSKVENETSPYHIVLAYCDMIIADTDYRFEDDGVTPSDDIAAHRITGLFAGEDVVCEGYAKALQLLLNVSNVDNVYVIGDAGGGHAWSLIRLDDGEWYWFDITWDDAGNYQSTWLAGRNYFAITDSTVIDTENNITFIQSHIPDTESIWGWRTLPERADTEFDGVEVTEALQSFTVGENTYQVVGYNSVNLIASASNGKVTVPDTVLYNGRLYDVVGTGEVDANGYTSYDSVFENNAVTELTFGKYVSRIQGIAYSDSLTKVTMSSSVKLIDSYAFFYCRALKDIYYDGTIEEWNAILKMSTWNLNCNTVTVHCKNGNITV